MNGSYLSLELRSFTPRCFLFLSRIIFLFLKDNIFIKNYILSRIIFYQELYFIKNYILSRIIFYQELFFYHVLNFYQELENFLLLWN